MKIFISYRRADNDYLVDAVRTRLDAFGPSVKVFLDVDSIGLGERFDEMIEREIAASGVVLALIGPAWQAERLTDPNDFVRRELLFARSHERRIIPALHSGRMQPDVTELPPELSWLPHLNTFSFSSARDLDLDLRRLFEQMTNRVPALQELRDRAWGLYERHEDDELLAVVEQAWTDHAATPSPALADCCRTGAVALSRRSGEAGRRDLWLVRALSTAYQSGASNAFAASLLPFFFRLLERNEPEAARQVIIEIGRLMQLDDPGQLPPASMMRRLYHEKLAYSYVVERRHEEALSTYRSALASATADGDRRGVLKCRGAIANCQWELGEDGTLAETLAVRDAADADGYVDVARAAAHNARVMSGEAMPLLPYEVT